LTKTSIQHNYNSNGIRCDVTQWQQRFTEDDFFFEESSSVDDVGFLSFARPEVKEQCIGI
jgi:hypothetical protein